MTDLIYFDDNQDEEIMQYQSNQIIKRGTLISANIADIHFSIKNIIPQMQLSILDEQFLSKIERLPKLDLVTILGDLYDHKVLTTSDAALYASIFIGKLVDICRKKNATLIIIQGTLHHDANQLKLYYHYMEEKDIDVRIVTRIQFEYVKDARILCIPELYSIDESVYNHFFNNSGFYDMAILHGTFEGAVYGDNSGNARLFRMSDFMNCRGPILGGHVHKPDCFQDHFYYCGSPYAWSFADDHKKSFILLAYNLDTYQYYIDREEIISYKYETIEMSQIINNDPQITIAYIDKLKKEKGIDYIRIIFTDQVSNIHRMILNHNYRDVQFVSLVFPKSEEEILQKKLDEESNNQLVQYGYLTDSRLSDEEKFCMYVNQLKGQENYITVDDLRKLLEEL